MAAGWLCGLGMGHGDVVVVGSNPTRFMDFFFFFFGGLVASARSIKSLVPLLVL